MKPVKPINATIIGGEAREYFTGLCELLKVPQDECIRILTKALTRGNKLK